MAIDTIAKRRSAASIKPILKAPIPDGVIFASDRVHIAWLYSGLWGLKAIELTLALCDRTASLSLSGLKSDTFPYVFPIHLTDYRELTTKLPNRSISLKMKIKD